MYNMYMHAVFIDIGELINLLCHSDAHMKISLKATSGEGFWKFGHYAQH